MKKKFNSKAGLTLVELLAVMAILVLLGLMMTTGLRMALRTYQSIVAQSEVELLLSTAVDALADDLRYAWDFEASEDVAHGNANVTFTYYSDSYGEKTRLDLDDDGQIVAKSVGNQEGWRVLPTGAYGSRTSFESYEVTDLRITHNADPVTREITFTIELTVAAETSDGTSVSASTPEGGVTVRCLNPMIVTVGGAGS